MNNYDILIVGSGMAGASLAVALKPLGYSIGLIDAYCFGEPRQPSYDDRSIALSYGSSRIYQGMGLWDALQHSVTPIKNIHVSDKGHLGATRLDAEQEGLSALGYLVESRVLGQHLHEQLQNSEIKLIAPARMTGVQSGGDALSVVLNQHGGEKQLGCKLLVAADGSNSQVRELMGIGVERIPYEQTAVVANITPEMPHQNQAFERFTADGPIALLPLSENRCSLVWTHHPDEVDSTMDLDETGFLDKLQNAFGYRLGAFVKAGKRSAFPLSLHKSKELTATRTVFIGNAAQTLHPVAGQGLNLGLRDIAELVELLADRDFPPGSHEMLHAYATHRQADRNTVIKYTDSLVKIFSNDLDMLGHFRAAGLMLVDRLPPLRHLLARQSMGFRHRKTRLARGLPVN